jgi:hypothetical protein
MIIAWKIWYKDNIVIEGVTAEDWAAAPDENVVGIAAHFGRNENNIMLGALVSGSDWYWLYDNQIHQSGTSSEIPGEWLAHSAPEGAILKKGSWTSNEEIARVDIEMIEWVKG